MVRQHDSQRPVNTAGLPFYAIEGVDICEWGPLPDGEGPATQVHMRIHMKDAAMPLIMRFKSPRAVDELIVALMTHRNGVWPDRTSV